MDWLRFTVLLLTIHLASSLQTLKQYDYQLEEDTTFVQTLGDSEYTTTVTLNAHFFVFYVKAESNAKLALTTHPGQTDSDAYIIELGADGNKKTTISRVGEDPIQADTPEELSSTEFRAFWITIYNNEIHIGRDLALGDEEIISITATDAHLITSISLTSAHDKTAQWKFSTVIGHEIIQETSTGDTDPEYTTWQTKHDANSFVFQVKAANEANIILSEDPYDTAKGYEISIGWLNGSVDYSSITIIGTGINMEFLTPYILSDEEYRTFWVSWQDVNRVQVGGGHQVGENLIMESEQGANIAAVSAIAVTSGRNKQGSWKISSFEVNNFKVETPTDGQQSQVWIYHETRNFEFYLRAADSAAIYFTRDPMNQDNNASRGFEVAFERDMAGVHIKKNPGGEILNSSDSKHYTDGLFKRKFWISWYSDSIQVGMGSLFQNTIVSYQTSSNDISENIRAIALSTQESTHMGHWEFSRDAGSNIVITTEAKAQNVTLRHWLELTDMSSIAFKVKACGGISLLLADIAGAPFAEVIIGDTEEPPNKIITLTDGQLVKEDHTSGILTCNMASWMWLSWDETTLTLGQGGDIGGSVFLDWTADNRKTIQSMAFRGLTTEPVFEFTKVPNRYYEVQTPTLQDFQTVTLAMHRTVFTFDVKASANAEILLKEVPNQETSRAIVVVLGDEKNTRSVIYSVEKQDEKVTKNGAVLDENDFKSFYIEWGNPEYVTVGRRDTNEILLQFSNSDNTIVVNEISILSMPEQATWRFPDNAAMVNTFYTSTDYRLDQVLRRVAGLNSFVFKTRAKADVHVVLFDHYHDIMAYEIVIGGSGNNYTLIRDRRGDHGKKVAFTPDILDEATFKEFWVTWKDGHIAVGYGRLPGYREIISYTDPTPFSVSYLALTTGFASDGLYQIHSIPDGTFLRTTSQFTDENQLTIRLNPTTTSYDFYVRACSHAVILLKTSGATSEEVYRLVLGDNDNSMTRLVHPDGRTVAYSQTPDLLDCYEGRIFHLSWARHQIRLLEMDARGRVIFEYQEPDENVTLSTANIHGLSLISLLREPAEWAITQYEGRQLQYKAGPALGETDTNYCCLWEAVQDRTFITFSVKACSHVSVLLTVNPGQYNGSDALEIVIGKDGSNQHEIRKGVNGNVLVSDNSPNLLSCTEHRTFWVSWSDSLNIGHISVGKGAVVDTQPIMVYANENNPITIGAYSVSSEDQNTADFRLGISAIENEFNVYTPNAYRYNQAFIAPRNQHFAFSVKACSDAHVYLQSDPFQTTREGYEIVFGGYSNTETDIRNGSHGNILEKYKERDILDCSSYRRFWVSWHDGIRIGKGIYPGLEEILKHEGDPVYDVYSVSLSTGFGSDGHWIWPVQSEDLVRLSYTQQESSERQLQWVAVSGLFEIVIRIRACQDASIALADVLGNTATDALEIRLGTNGNKQSTIHEKYGGDISFILPMENTLSCNEFRTFWIRWTTMSVSVGSGADFRQRKIMEYSPRSPFPSVHALGMGSSSSSPIDWELVKMFGDTISIRTPSLDDTEPYRHMIVTPKFDDVSFRLRTCMEGGLSLRTSADADMSPGYEIVIDRNQRSEIRRIPDGEFETGGPLIASDCDHYRSYWTSWAASTIRFGAGSVPGTLEFLTFDDPNPIAITAVGIGSLNKHAGHWEFKLQPGDQYRFYTYHHEYLNSPQISVLGMTSIVFNVKACAGARLTVSTVAGMVGALAHEVILGDHNNQKVVIWDLGEDRLLTMKDFPDVISCNESRTFWLSWQQGHLRVGSGDEVGSQEILDYPDSLPDVTSLSLATYKDIEGTWDVSLPDIPQAEIPVDSTSVKTTGDSIYRTTMTLNAHYLVFHVKAESNAKLALSIHPGKTDSDAYIIELGADNNQRTTIGKVGEDLLSKETPDILSSTDARAFWVTMTGNEIKLGKGDIPGDNVEITAEATDAHLVTSISFTSSNNKEATWSFGTLMGHEVIQETATGNTDYEYTSWKTTENERSFVFQVKTAKNANILLSNTLHGISNVFEIVIGLDGDKTVIRTSMNGENNATSETPGIVNDGEYRTFWISWQDTSAIKVGHGHRVGELEELSLVDIDATKIKAVAITSGKESQASWRISSFGINNFKVETPVGGMQSQIWIYHESQYFEFYLRGGDIATVFLTEMPMNSDNSANNGYEVQFSTNTGVQLKRNPGGNFLLESHLVGIIDGYTKRKFWISWYSDTVRVGWGNLLENIILEHHLSAGAFNNIRAIALSTASSTHMGHWEFSRGAGSDIVVTAESKTTNVAPRHWLELTDMSRLAFKVKACEGISLLLADIAGAPFAEVTIGATTEPRNKIITLIDGVTVKEDNTAGILTCNIASWMWLSWDDMTLTLGQGADIGGSVFLDWTAENRKEIQSMAFRGLTTEPVFEFTKVPNLYYEVKTPKLQDFQTVRLAMHGNFFTFDVKASSTAKILLKEVPQQEDSRAIVVILGDEGNTRSVMYRVERQDDPLVKDGAVLDENQFKSFYINWESYGSSRTVVVGRQDLNESILVFDDSNDPIDVNEISIQSEPETAIWRFPDNIAMVTTFYTSKDYQIDQVFRRVAGTHWFVFKVRAKADAHIILFDHNHAKEAYEIVIGSSGNTYTTIRNQRLTNDKATARTPDILDNDHYKEFWVSWKDGHIVVGYGRLPGYRQIVAYRDENPVSVSYLSLTTGFNSDGFFEIHSIPDGTFLRRTTPSTDEEELTIRLNPTTTTYDFYVRACSHAVILLKTSGATSDEVYRLVLGDTDNMETKLLDPNGDLLATSSTPYILSCTDGRTFHLSWARHQLRLLQTNSRGKALFEYNEPNQNTRLSTASIHGLSMVSQVSTPAEWFLYQYEGRQLQFKAGPPVGNINTNYCCLWEAIQDRTSITFSVRACSHVAILLTTNPGQYSGDDAFEVVIGAGGENKHEIRKGVNGDVLASGNSPDLLSCTEHRAFWVSWSDSLTSSHISVGSGAVVHTQQIMVYTNNDNPTTVGAYSVSSEDRNIADFRLGTSAIVNEFNVYTPDDYTYSHAVIAPQNPHFIFAVKACTDAHVFLEIEPFQSAPRGYEIVLGGYKNTKSDIRNGTHGRILAEHDEEILSCNAYHKFWVSWYDGVRVGKGDYVGQSEIMVHTGDPVYQVHSVTLSTGFGSDGQWSWPVQYEDLARLSYKVQATEEKQFQWIAVPGYFELMFRIRACQDISIALADVLGTVTTQAAEVRIGTNNNKESSIHEKYGYEAIVSASTDGILSCNEFRTFWMRWSTSSVVVGQGGRFHEGQIMEHITENGLPSVHVIGIASSKLSKIDWELVKIYGDTVSIRTPKFNEAESYKHMIVIPKSQSVNFRLRTCMEGALSLRASVEADKSPGYEIVIDKDQRIIIRRLPDGDEVARSDPVILSNCDHYRTYWASWNDSTISFGAGIVPGRLEIMAYTDPNPISIGAVSVASLNEHSSHWEFWVNPEDQYRFYTYHHEYLNSPRISVLGLTSTVFNVKACAGARLTVSTIAGITSTLAHEVILGDYNNREIVIFDLGSRTVLQRINATVLSCDESRTFWLSWEHGNLRVGSGDKVGSSELLSHPDSLKDVTSLSLATYNNIDGIWDISFHSVQTTVAPPTTTTTGVSSTPSISDSPSSSTGDPQRPNPGGGGGLSAGEVVGVVFGVIAAIILLGILVFFAERKWRKRDIENQPLVFRNPQYDDHVEMSNTSPYNASAGVTEPSYSDSATVPQNTSYDINLHGSDFDVGIGAYGADNSAFDTDPGYTENYPVGGDVDDGGPVLSVDLEQDTDGGEMDA